MKSDIRSVLMAQANAEELEALQDFKQRRDDARFRSAALSEKAQALDTQAHVLSKVREAAHAKRRAALVAKALGEGGPESPPAADATGPSPAELQDAAAILRERAAEASKEAEAAHGGLRARVCDLIENGAQRLGEKYLAQARALAATHAGILAAQELLRSAGVSRTLVDQTWTDLLVPNSTALAALKNVGVLRGSPHQRLPVVGGDEGAIRRTVAAEASDAKSDVRSLLGGEWPLERS